MSEVYIDASHLLINEAFAQALKIKGWSKYEAILYMAQRSRMLGINGQVNKDRNMSNPMIATDKTKQSSIVIDEMVAGKFYEIR